MNNKQILMIHGTNYQEMTKQILTAADLAADIGNTQAKIGLKPNLVVAKPAASGATTHPEMIAGAIEYLHENGFYNLIVLEGSWVGEDTSQAWVASGLKNICDFYHVPFIDLQKDDSTEMDAKGLSIKICNEVLSVDYLINMPVLKGHCQTSITCALKNNKGLIPNSEKRRFHRLGLHKPIAHLSTVVPQHFILVDNICGDLDFEEGGNPVTMNRIFCCKDPVLCDTFVCETMGFSLDDVPYIKLAEQLGSGSTNLAQAEIIALNQSELAAGPGKMTHRIKELAEYVQPLDACSACYGSLIYALSRLEEQDQLRHRQGKICIGQGYRGKSDSLGVGNCTANCQKSLEGCPPKSIDIVHFLENNWL